MKYALIFIALVLCIGGAQQVFSSKPDAPTLPDKATLERDIFNEVNRVRVGHGLEPTTWDDTLYLKAQERCDIVAQEGYLIHSDVYSPWSENLFGSSAPYGYCKPESITPEGIVLAWLNSPLHCHFMLSDKVEHSAVAVSFDNGFWVAWSYPRYGEPVGYSPWY